MANFNDIRVRHGTAGYRLLVDGKVRKRGKEIWPLLDFWRKTLSLSESDEYKIALEFQAHRIKGKPIAEVDPLSRTVWLSLMLCPSLFEKRLDVLAHLFLVAGNGYRWFDGRLVDGFDYNPDPASEIKVSDLNHDDSLFDGMIDEVVADPTQTVSEKRNKVAQFTALSKESKRRRRKKSELEIARRQAVAENIHAISTTPDHSGFIYSDGYATAVEAVEYLDSGSCLGDLPDRMERSHFDGLCEIIDAVIRGSDPDRELPPSKWMVPYKEYTQEEKLEACSRLKEFRESLPGKIEVFDD